jgi:hypothetical protein
MLGWIGVKARGGMEGRLVGFRDDGLSSNGAHVCGKVNKGSLGTKGFRVTLFCFIFLCVGFSQGRSAYLNPTVYLTLRPHYA